MANVSEVTRRKWRTLVVRLVEHSNDGKLDWDSGARTNEIVASIGKFLVSMRQLGNDFHFTISGEFGETIDSFSDDDILDQSSELLNYSQLVDMYNSVIRGLSGADAALDQIIMKLSADQDDDLL